MTLLAADIGGTKIAVALITDDGVLLNKVQEPTNLDGPKAVVEQIVTMSQQLTGSANRSFTAAGASVPAALSGQESDRVLWAPNLPGWRDIAFREMLSHRLNVPAFLEFDGHASALGEWWVGAGRGCRSVASIIIGTGIGGGFIIDGKLWTGRNRLAGAVGWMPVHGPHGVDHWENLAAGPGIAKRAQELLAAGKTSCLQSDSLTAKDVFEAARRGDHLASEVIDETAKIIGRSIAGVISLVNPEIVVLGGSVGQQGDLLLETVQDTARAWAQPISAEGVQIVSSFLGEEASLLGAAYSAFLRLKP